MEGWTSPQRSLAFAATGTVIGFAIGYALSGRKDDVGATEKGHTRKLSPESAGVDDAAKGIKVGEGADKWGNVVFWKSDEAQVKHILKRILPDSTSSARACHGTSGSPSS